MPDGRAWTAVGLFALGVFELLLMAGVPVLRADDTFKAITIGTFNGGIFLVAGHFFGSSMASSAKDATIASLADTANVTAKEPNAHG